LEDLDHLKEERILRWKLSEFQNHLYDTSFIPHSRGKDLILTAWYRVLSLEVDPALIEHPVAQKTAAVSPTEKGGESGLVKAFILLNKGYEAGRRSSMISRKPWGDQPSIKTPGKDGVCKGNTENSIR
jgi:acyl-coenzyme A synthetase/AMP-(fatty) acid ligase